jgi:hypothetical protein
MSQLESVQQLAQTLQANATVLEYAKNVATAIVAGPANHCAATLSSLLVFVEIYPNGGGTGSGDLEPLVVNLAFDLEKRRGWEHIDYDPANGPAQPLQAGDVAVVIASAAVHHIFLIIDPADQADPLIADNQGAGMHNRPLAGDAAQNYSPTSYILRAPA